MFGAAFAGGWALANVFGLIGEYILTSALSHCRHGGVRTHGIKVEPFTTPAQRASGVAVPALILDHIVIGGETLGQGVAYIRDLLGVHVPPWATSAWAPTITMRLGGETYLNSSRSTRLASRQRIHAGTRSTIRCSRRGCARGRGRSRGWPCTPDIDATLSASRPDLVGP